MRLASVFAAVALSALALPIHAADKPAKADAGQANKADQGKKADGADDTDQAMFPPPKSVKQSAMIGGRRIDYIATVGAIPVKDDQGKVTGEVVYTAFTVPGRDAAQRPVTFAFNGGPGAASVFLDLGAIGPKKIPFGVTGHGPSDSPVLQDNPNSWLDFTDLVFIDPIGTGFSRSHLDEEKTKKAFYTADADIHYLSRTIYEWLLHNDRLTSPKYLAGESYGGYRVPRLAHYLQTTVGVGLSGITMVSPYLDPPAIGEEDALSPLPWMINLTAMAAGHFEREGKTLNEALMAPVEQYDRTQFVQDFLAGTRDKAATDRLSAHVAELTGLDPTLVRRLDGRVDIQTYLREIRRSQGLIGSVYDSDYTAYDPFPASAEPRYQDPLLDGPIAPLTSAMVNFVTNIVGWQVDGPYHTLSFEVNKAWDRDNSDTPVADLRKALADDPRMAVTIAHGWNDLSCPYFGSKLILAQLPTFGVENRVALHVYPGGHMFYARPDSAAAFRRDVMKAYGVG